MKREHRKQIKRDELVTGMERAALWVRTHRDEVRATLIGVAVVVVGAFGYTTFQGRRTASAEKAFADAFDTFHAPVAAEVPPGAEKPVGLQFATPAEKYQKAAAAFDGVERRYGSLPAGGPVSPTQRDRQGRGRVPGPGRRCFPGRAARPRPHEPRLYARGGPPREGGPCFLPAPDGGVPGERLPVRRAAPRRRPADGELTGPRP